VHTCRLVGVAQEAHLKRLRRIAAESQDMLQAAKAAYLACLRRAAAQEAAQREGVGAAVLLFIKTLFIHA